MPRTFDDRPVPGDSGYTERTRPPISALGKQICREVLDHFGASYTINYNNDVITVESAKDFFRTLDVIAQSQKVNKLALQVERKAGEVGGSIVFDAGSVRLRLADELAEVALVTGAVQLDAQGAGSYAARSFNDQLFLRTLVKRDPDLNETADEESPVPS